MAVELSTLYSEVLKVCALPARNVHFKWRAEIVINGVPIEAFAVVATSWYRDYVKNFAEELVVQLMIPEGKFTYEIYPNRRNLKLRLYKYPTSELGSSINPNLAIAMYEGKAVLFDTRDSSVEGNSNINLNENKAETGTLNAYSFQMIDPVIDQIRLAQCGGIFNNIAPGDLLKALMTHYSSKLDLPSELKPLGVGMVPPNNTNVEPVLIVPQTTPLVDQTNRDGLAREIQLSNNGLYNGGIGCFYQKRFWHIFPPYDISRFEKEPYKITIANIPRSDAQGLERTFRVEGNNVFILAVGDVVYEDRSEFEQLNAGNGMRFASSKKLFDGFMQGKGNRAEVSRNQNFNEFTIDPNPSGVNNAPQAGRKISDNKYAQMSKLAFRRGATMSLAWPNADIDIIKPGAPVRVLYLKEGQTRALDGTVVGVESVSTKKGNLGADEGYLHNAVIHLFVGRSEIDKKK